MTLEELGREYLAESERLAAVIEKLKAELREYNQNWKIQPSKKTVELAWRIKVLDEERRELKINGEKLVNYYRRDE